MQPKRSVNYRILKDLGLKVELRFGFPTEYVELQIIRTDSGVTLTSPKHFRYGILRPTKLEKLDFSHVLTLSPPEVNAALWKNIQTNYYALPRNLPIDSPYNLNQEERWRLESYCDEKGLSTKEKELILEVSKTIATILEEATTARDFEEEASYE
jgi:hypothetical protein